MSGRPKKTHYDYRTSICFFCCRKGDRHLSSGQIEYIKENILPDFEIHKEFLPLGQCGSCRRTICLLTGKNPSGRSASLPSDNDYDAIIQELSSLPRGTQESTDCSCVICEYGRSKVSDKLKAGRKKTEISGDTSRDNRSLNETRVEEIDRLMKNLTPRTKSGLGHALIKEKQQSKSGESPIQFTAATGGASLPVFTGSGAKRKLDYKQQPINNEVFKQIQIKEGLSNRSVQRIQSEVRKNVGHNSVQSGKYF